MLLQVQELLDEKAELERSLRISNEKLAAALADCNAKDIITKKQVKIAQEAIAGDLISKKFKLLDFCLPPRAHLPLYTSTSDLTPFCKKN